MSTDRDQAIERLLRQARTEPAADGCPDAELLAAWSEGGLREAERDGLELHVSDCARCQAILAALVEPVSAQSVVTRAPLWRRWHLEWLAPITAAAAAVILWAVVPGNGPARVSDFARIEPEAIPATPSPPVTETLPAPAQSAQSAAQEAAGARSAERERPGEQPTLRRDAAEAAKPLASPPPERAEARAAADAQPSSLSDQAAQSQSAAAPGTAPQRAAAPVPAGAPPAPAPAAPAPVVEPSSPADTVRGGQTAAGGRGGAGNGAGLGAAAVRGFAASAVVVSPEPAVRWRLRGDGLVDLSTNGGASWDPLQTGVTEGLLAGSSPGPSICWAVGRAGIVIVTTDMRNWRRVTFPEAVDLTAVQATDVQSATVRSADGRAWQTRDGGATWTASPQDF